MVYALSALQTLITLRWRQSTPRHCNLPPYIQRHFVPTIAGPLELLICSPQTPQSNLSPLHPPPLFFLHGGFGSAATWLPWLIYLHEHNYPATLYAFSVRGHGASYSLGYMRHVFGTSFEDVLSDAISCLRYALEHEDVGGLSDGEIALVGHSSGGGVAQKLLAGMSLASPLLKEGISASTATTMTGMKGIKINGLMLVDAIPHFGSLDIYTNWLRHDPWFPLRTAIHLFHPASPLSTLELVRGAFFGRKASTNMVHDLWKIMPGYESLGWPSGMYGRGFWEWLFGRGENRWLEAGDIVRGLLPVPVSKSDKGRERIAVMVGKEDMMYRPWMWERMVAEYAMAIAKQDRSSAKTDVKNQRSGHRKPGDDEAIDSVEVSHHDGVQLLIVKDSGHHVQNDVKCQEAAEGLRRWALQL